MVVVGSIPALVLMFYTIRRHYVEMAQPTDRRLPPYRPPKLGRHPVIVLVAGMNRGVIAALTYARAMSPNVTALTVDLDSTSHGTPPDALGASGRPTFPWWCWILPTDR